jgi:hypothetical protein
MGEGRRAISANWRSSLVGTMTSRARDGGDETACKSTVGSSKTGREGSVRSILTTLSRRRILLGDQDGGDGHQPGKTRMETLLPVCVSVALRFYLWPAREGMACG